MTLALLAVCARKGKGKAPRPPSSMPASGLGFLLPICSGEGFHFLGDLGRSRIKKYFLFKYEGGKTLLKKTRPFTQEHSLQMLTKLRFHSV